MPRLPPPALHAHGSRGRGPSQRLFVPAEFPGAKSRAQQWELGELTFRDGLLLTDLVHPEWFTQRDINPTAAELALFEMSGAKEFRAALPPTRHSLALMPGDRVAHCHAALDLPQNDVETHIGWITDIENHKGVRWAKVRHLPGHAVGILGRLPGYQPDKEKGKERLIEQDPERLIQLGHLPSAPRNNFELPVSQLGHHVLSRPRPLQPDDRIIVVAGDIGLGKMARVFSLDEAAGTVTFIDPEPQEEHDAKQAANDTSSPRASTSQQTLQAAAEEADDPKITVQINDVGLCFWIGDTVAVTDGTFRGCTGFITALQNGVAEIWDVRSLVLVFDSFNSHCITAPPYHHGHDGHMVDKGYSRQCA